MSKVKTVIFIPEKCIRCNSKKDIKLVGIPYEEQKNRKKGDCFTWYYQPFVALCGKCRKDLLKLIDKWMEE